MRNKINVFYYPDFWVDYVTLVKGILLFDELHFMDRPSIMFGGRGVGQFGTVGAASPLRQYETSFREQGLPLYVHQAPMGPVDGEWYEQIKADVNDANFLKRFQEGLKSSSTFRKLQIAHGNYGEYGGQDAVAERLMGVDLSVIENSHGNAMALFEDPLIRHFELSTVAGCGKHLVANAVTCSAKLNFALTAGTEQGFFPLADANPYGDLLGTKYARAISAIGASKNKIQVTDLSFAIFDELIPAENLRKLTLKDAIHYRKASESARVDFLEQLNIIQAKQGSIGIDGDYQGAIQKIIETEIKPAARAFKNKLKTIDESLFASLVKGTLGFLGGSSAVKIFGDLSWTTLLPLAGSAGAYMGNAAIDAWLTKRTATRDCSISYILSLD